MSSSISLKCHRQKVKPDPLTGPWKVKWCLLQAAEYFQAKRLIPDIATWIQCYALYMAVVMTKRPERASSMLMYMSSIANLSNKYKWPSWLVYDNSYRQEAAEQGKTDWSKGDGTLHSQCFNGMAKNAERWCSICHSLDHVKENCPLRPPGQSMKRPSPTYSNYPQAKRMHKAKSAPICKKYNRFDGECNFGGKCNYQHICSKCGKWHPASLCQKSDGESSKAK